MTGWCPVTPVTHSATDLMGCQSGAQPLTVLEARRRQQGCRPSGGTGEKLLVAMAIPPLLAALCSISHLCVCLVSLCLSFYVFTADL